MLFFTSATDVRHHGPTKAYQKVGKVEAVIARQAFEIVTVINGEIERIMNGQEGDVICIGPDEEIWKVDKDIFHSTYRKVQDVSSNYPPRFDRVVGRAYRDYDDFFDVDKVACSYLLPDGSWFTPPFESLVFNTPDAVAMVVYNEDTDTIELVRQFRIAVDSWITELPAGICTKGGPLEDVVREVKEELGYAVTYNDVQHISTFALSPGRATEKIHLYHVMVNNDMQTGALVGNKYEGEHIERVSMELWEAVEAVQDGRIWDAKTIIGVNWLIHR